MLIGEEMWLESSDQLREDKFYRFNQTLQKLFNLAAKIADGRSYAQRQLGSHFLGGPICYRASHKLRRPTIDDISTAA